ncbi:hypothetical protein EON80_07685 [bacterium]|nr:MAG: hypothetical protein EON80_07685 [bacterium]
MTPHPYPRTAFKQTVDQYLTSDELSHSSQLWSQLMTDDFRTACEALERATPRVRDAIKMAIRWRNEDGRDHENPFG